MLRCARFEWAWASSDATSCPTSRARSMAQPAPSRSSASRSAGSASNALWPWSGGGWVGFASSVDMCMLSPRHRSRCEFENCGDQGVWNVAVAVCRERADQCLADRSHQRGGRGLPVVKLELAALDALLEHLYEHVAVAAAEDQALRLHRRIHRLGDERVGARG